MIYCVLYPSSGVGIEVPHNDFANFFTNTDQIIGLTQ